FFRQQPPANTKASSVGQASLGERFGNDLDAVRDADRCMDGMGVHNNEPSFLDGGHLTGNRIILEELQLHLVIVRFEASTIHAGNDDDVGVGLRYALPTD